MENQAKIRRQEAIGLIRRAVMAPSSHNTQPWLFRLSESAIDLLADRRRALPANDPEDRELTISCGCALMNLRLAAASLGLGAKVQLLPDPGEPDWLARISFGMDPETTSMEQGLVDCIETRHTYRKAFAPGEVASAALEQLVEAAGIEGALLHPLLTGEDRHRAAILVSEGDVVQWSDPAWRRELAAWMHPRRRGDGLSVPALLAPVEKLTVRTFDMGGGVGAKDRDRAEASPLLATLCTTGDRPHDWLQAGQALQRILLVACRNGLQASFFNQPIQVARLRPALQGLVGGGFPQILLGVGRPREAPPPSPRRDVAEVITVA